MWSILIKHLKGHCLPGQNQHFTHRCVKLKFCVTLNNNLMLNSKQARRKTLAGRDLEREEVRNEKVLCKQSVCHKGQMQSNGPVEGVIRSSHFFQLTKEVKMDKQSYIHAQVSLQRMAQVFHPNTLISLNIKITTNRISK